MTELRAQAEPVPPPDTLNEIGVLKRREIEARIVGPLLERFGAEFGSERVNELAREVIVEVAHRQGGQMAEMLGRNDLGAFAATMPAWTKDDALQIEVLEQTPERLSFNVTRCRYAEMYRALGIPELGALFSCNRDGAMIGGFNPDVNFSRTQTIMGGASHCDFRFSIG
jgi:hypothetical protein